MRSLTRRLPAMSAAAVIVAVPVAAACASGSAAQHPATVSLTRRSPVSVAGRYFTPRRAVRVRVIADRTETRTARPNLHGSFTATFSTSIDRCSGYRVTATQPGRAPVVIRGAKPECAPMGAP